MLIYYIVYHIIGKNINIFNIDFTFLAVIKNVISEYRKSGTIENKVR